MLFTTEPAASAAALSAWGRAHGVTELALPRDVRVLAALPLLATGKPDFARLNALAVEGAAAPVCSPGAVQSRALLQSHAL